MTISRKTVRAVRALAAAGRPIRHIGPAVGIARSSVQRILAGRGPHAHLLAEPVQADEDPDFEGRPERCSECGRLVVLQDGVCVACRTLRAAMPFLPAEAASEPVNPAVAEEPTLDELLASTRIPLELEGEELERYEEMHRRKVEEQERVEEEREELEYLPEPTDAELERLERRAFARSGRRNPCR